MPTKDWKQIAELAGIAAIVASLVFVGFQLRQEHLIARSQVWSDRVLIRSELATLINDNFEVWIKGVKGGELTEAESTRFTAIATVYFYKESIQYLQRLNDISPAPPEKIALQLVDMLESHPGLKSAWTVHVQYHSDRDSMSPFHEEVEQLLTKIESGELQHRPIDSFAPFQ